MALATTLATLATIAGIGAAAAPAAAASASPVAATPPSPTAAAGSVCDDGAWRGPDGINVEGRPDSFDAGARGGVYVWHGRDGWHLRTTDATDVAHSYTGTVALSPGARFTSFSTVRLEKGDHVWVDGQNVLHYAFTTYRGIDGVDWTVSACDGARSHEAMRLSLDINGHEDDPGRIYLGDSKQHPGAASFTVTRAS